MSEEVAFLEAISDNIGVLVGNAHMAELEHAKTWNPERLEDLKSPLLLTVSRERKTPLIAIKVAVGLLTVAPDDALIPLRPRPPASSGAAWSAWRNSHCTTRSFTRPRWSRAASRRTHRQFSGAYWGWYSLPSTRRLSKLSYGCPPTCHRY